MLSRRNPTRGYLITHHKSGQELFSQLLCLWLVSSIFYLPKPIVLDSDSIASPSGHWPDKSNLGLSKTNTLTLRSSIMTVSSLFSWPLCHIHINHFQLFRSHAPSSLRRANQKTVTSVDIPKTISTLVLYASSFCPSHVTLLFLLARVLGARTHLRVLVVIIVTSIAVCLNILLLNF